MLANAKKIFLKYDGAVCTAGRRQSDLPRPEQERCTDKMKTQTVLALYDALMSGKKIFRHDFCVSFGVNDRTFYRYMREISAYLRQAHPDYVVDVAPREGRYFLKKIAEK